MSTIDSDNPFQAPPVPDPETDHDGIIWAAPHTHEVAVEEGIEAVSQAMAARARGDDEGALIFQATWLHLTNRQFLASLLTLTSRKLDESAGCINLAFVPGAHSSIPAWAAALIPDEGIEAGLPSQLVADACLSSYRTLDPEVLDMVMQDPDLLMAYDRALLGTALLSAYRGENLDALEGLLQKNTDPFEVLHSLLQVFDYVASEVDDAQ
ncbi:hypothetical protein [Arthrobacter sp. zg-Y1171]|uniref:hypothetical protein n=1 Tax=Arthrobacter sp. zg-Y1171 TaxID=2964610 RepID=UPI00210540B3|nr:hypothetical protein [Arthrobacter sp. zg-Y1171]MCQ1996869.1 hypothetical protein [Arthrobacter sp. zg-Y1171]UWX82457.1 hypothetical protein N2L00_03225 [Arthrobacter sp. zg-Y1171]